MLPRPDPSEYDPFYSTYVDQVPDGDIIDLLATEREAVLALLRPVPVDRETYSYSDGKWSIREVVGHVIDAERLFAFRALTFARGDRAPLPGMDNEQWAAVSNAHTRPLVDLLEEFDSMRRGHEAMFAGFDDAAGARIGVASGCSFTVRSLAYIVVGHGIHHRKVLAQRYL